MSAVTIIEQLESHPDNPRKDVGDVTELAGSIKHSGIMQNLTVVPHEGRYRVVIGRRRLAAAKLAGLAELPCIVSDMDYKEQCSTMLSENMQRVDLTVTEQVQGVQLLLNLGESVEEIARKTGFTSATVKKRAKLSVLPADKLKEADNRGGTLEEYVRITQIEDEKMRFNLLNAAGTRDFEWKFKEALRAQDIEKYMPLMRAEAKKIANKMKNPNERWSSKFEEIGSVDVAGFKDDKSAFEKFTDKGELFWFEEYSGKITIYKKAANKKAVNKKSQKEIEAEKARKRIQELTETAFELRRAFLDSTKITAENTKTVEKYICLLSSKSILTYRSTDRSILDEAVKPYKKTEGYCPKLDEIEEWLSNDRNSRMTLLKALIGDSKSEGYYRMRYNEDMPMFERNERLDVTYKILSELGYRMSSMEEKLMNGTHEALGGEER